MMLMMTTTMTIKLAFINYRRRESYVQDKGLYGNNTTEPNQNVTDYFTPKLRSIPLVKLNNL